MPLLGIIGDVHAEHARLRRILDRLAERRVDGVLLVGDLGSDDLSFASLRSPAKDAKYLDSVATVLSAVAGLGVPYAYVPGNHDLPDLHFPGNADHRRLDVTGLSVSGVGGAGPARFGFCYEWDESEIAARTVPTADVLLCHAPPIDTPIDWIPTHKVHAGSSALREIAEKNHGFYVCGHIHESPGALLVGESLCLNAGGLGKPFGRTQVGFLQRDEDGDAVGHEDLEGGPVRWWKRTELETAR